jgi:chromosome partitioning protein
MRAKIVSVTNQKGGCGKTNLAVNFAGTAIRHGYKTVVVDADPQGTALQWVGNAEEGAAVQIPVIGLSHAGAKITHEIKKYIDDYDLIIVDCPPAVESPVPQAMLLISDLALVPVVPNPGDLWAATALLELAERMMGVNETLRVALVASIVRPNLGMTKSALQTMATMKDNMPLFKAQINQRAAYPESMLSGDSVHALGSAAKAAIKEIEALYAEAMKQLHLKVEKKS